MTMLRFALVLVLAACGGKQTTTGPSNTGSGSAEPDPPGVVQDTRTPIEKRRDTACDALGPKLTQCAVDDAKAAYAAGKVSKAEFEASTTAEIQAKNTDEFLKQCKVDLSTRQVRVLEVCFAEEKDCGPLFDCLGHLNDKPADNPASK